MWKLLALGACALVLAACGSASQPKAGGRAADPGLELARCMRGHGVPNFPDPIAGQGIKIDPGSGVNPQAPSFQSALQTCRRYLPNFPAPGTMSARQREKAVAFARCMRSHGQPDFPDPTVGAPRPGVVHTVLALRGMFFAIGAGIDPKSPAFRQAAAHCGIRTP